MKMAAGDHLDFEDDYYVSRIKGIYTINKITPAFVDRSNGSKVIAFIVF
jgi:hypothetical protein